MAKIVKTWKERMQEIKPSEPKMTEKGNMYISNPIEIAEIVKQIPKGKLITTKIIAEKLTKKHGVDFTCPLTTGIFFSIVANACEEDKTLSVPYWRVVKDEKGLLYPAYLTHELPQKEHLESEGYKVKNAKNGKMYVENARELLIEK